MSDQGSQGNRTGRKMGTDEWHELPALEKIHLSDRVIGKAEVARLTGFHLVTIDRLVKQGLFPRPFRIGQRQLGWRYGTVVDFLRKLEAEAQLKTAAEFAAERRLRRPRTALEETAAA